MKGRWWDQIAFPTQMFQSRLKIQMLWRFLFCFKNSLCVKGTFNDGPEDWSPFLHRTGEQRLAWVSLFCFTWWLGESVQFMDSVRNWTLCTWFYQAANFILTAKASYLRCCLFTSAVDWNSERYRADNRGSLTQAGPLFYIHHPGQQIGSHWGYWFIRGKETWHLLVVCDHLLRLLLESPTQEIERAMGRLGRRGEGDGADEVKRDKLRKEGSVVQNTNDGSPDSSAMNGLGWWGNWDRAMRVGYFCVNLLVSCAIKGRAIMC